MWMKAVFWLIFAVVIYLLILLLIGPYEVFIHLASVPVHLLLLSLLLILLSMYIEFQRWDFYLRTLDIRLSHNKSLLHFLAGGLLLFLPVKSGEFFRSILLKKENVPYRKSLAVVFISNFTLFAVVLLFALPVLLLFEYYVVFICLLLFVIFAFFSFRNYRFYSFLLKKVHYYIPLRFLLTLSQSLRHSRKLVRTKVLAKGLLLTIVHESLIGIAFILIAASFELGIASVFGFSIYNLSALIGVFSFLPGGVGAVESGNILMLSQFTSVSQAAALTIIMRGLTLWLTILFAVIALNLLHRSK